MSAGREVSFRYFSGTGNSRRIAELCALAFAGAGWKTDSAAIPQGGPPLPTASAACFVFPVYALDLPRIARRYLEALPDVEACPALLLVTGGDPDDCGWAAKEGRRFLVEHGFDVSWADLVHMPNNWGTFMEVPSHEEASGILAAAELMVSRVVASFLAGGRYEKALDLGKFGPLGSRLMRAGFKLGVRRLWSRFRTNGNCSSCGLCARSCPTGSIRMDQGRPRWSATCEQCMRCFNICPTRAILQLDSIGKGSTRGRWMEPNFSVADALQDNIQQRETP